MPDAATPPNPSANPFRDAVREGRVLLGLCHTYPAAGIVEGMCRGWDFVWIDAQHGQIDLRAALESLRVADAMGLASLLRVPGHDATELARYADLAPAALMVPMVNTAPEAEALVRAVRFPPRGERSYGGRRVVDLWGREYYKHFEPALIVQIETEQAAQQAHDIAQVEGVDGLFFGPDDMKLSLGLPIDASPADEPRLAEAMRSTAEAARVAGKLAACVAAGEPASRLAVEMGYQCIVGGGDIAFLRARAAEQLTLMRTIVSEHTATGTTS